MEVLRTIPVIREQPLWLTEEEAFTLLIGLVRGAAVDSPAEEALLDKVGQLCRSFLSQARQPVVEDTPEETWRLEPAGRILCQAA